MPDRVEPTSQKPTGAGGLTTLLGQFERAFLFFLGLMGGAILGSILSFVWDLPESVDTWSPTVTLGIALTYAVFGLIPAAIFGLPAILFLKRRNYSGLPATATLAVGGAAVGALLMLVTFTGFEWLGATAGASIGFALGVSFFFVSPRAEKA